MPDIIFSITDQYNSRNGPHKVPISALGKGYSTYNRINAAMSEVLELHIRQVI